MSTFNYLRTADQADKLLARFGQPLTVNRASAADPAYDPTTGAATPASPVAATANGVVTGYTITEMSSSVIRSGDVRILISRLLSIVPIPGDTITANGQLYRVVANTPVNPAGVLLLHDIQART